MGCRPCGVKRLLEPRNGGFLPAQNRLVVRLNKNAHAVDDGGRADEVLAVGRRREDVTFCPGDVLGPFGGRGGLPVGGPRAAWRMSAARWRGGREGGGGRSGRVIEKTYLMDVTDHPLATADLQIREPAFSLIRRAAALTAGGSGTHQESHCRRRRRGAEFVWMSLQWRSGGSVVGGVVLRGGACLARYI